MTKTLSMYDGEVHLEFDDAMHAYFWREVGKPVAGVTSILNLLNKPALPQWAANSAVDFVQRGYIKAMESGDGFLQPSAFDTLCQEAKTAHRRISKEATDIGSLVHKFAEDVLADRCPSLPTDERAAKACAAFLDWFHSREVEKRYAERMVLSRKWYYAGTVDFFGRIDDELCVLDFKTSSGLYLEMILQLAAYAVALEEETGERINVGWIVRLDKKTGKFEPYRIPLTQQKKDAWLRVREAHEMVSKIDGELNELRNQRAA